MIAAVVLKLRLFLKEDRAVRMIRYEVASVRRSFETIDYIIWSIWRSFIESNANNEDISWSNRSESFVANESWFNPPYQS